MTNKSSRRVKMNGVTGRIVRGRAVAVKVPNCAMSKCPSVEELSKGMVPHYRPHRD